MLSRKLSKVFSLCLMMLIVCSMILPTAVFAEITALSSETNGVRSVSFNSATGITAEQILVNMGGASGENYVKGKVTFTSDGTLSVNTKGQDYSLLTVGDGVIYVSPKSFDEAKPADVNKAMRLFVDAMADFTDEEDAVQQIMADLQDTDSSVGSVMLPLVFEKTEADIYTAYRMAEPFLNVLSKVLGVGCIILILLLLFSTVMDLAYIGLPVWREAQANKDGGNKHPMGVSYEALTTVQEIEKGIGGGDGGYRNSYVLYFKRRALTYIILAICIMYLICGGLSGVISFVLQLVSGIAG